MSPYLYAVLLGSCFTLLACGGPSPAMPLSSTSPFPLNDTGTSYCRGVSGETQDCAQAPEQDGNTGRDALAQRGSLGKEGGGVAGFDFTKLDADGEPLVVQDQAWEDSGDPAAGTQWHCVRDNHTGMIWEVKSVREQSLNHRDARYQWYDLEPTRNGGFAGASSTEECGPIRCDTEAFITAMNEAAWCGIDQWRLPTVSEYLSLVVTDHPHLAADSDYFPHMQANHYWTGQSYAPDRTMAWYMYFSDGSPANTLKDKSMYLRLVYHSGVD